MINLVIPNPVTSIGEYAFSSCKGLKNVKIPNSVSSIGDKAFYNCTGLETATIPASITTFGKNMFEGCTNLTIVDIGAKVIGDYAFKDCINLTDITVQNTVNSVNWGAFSGCTGLSNIELPNSITSIGSYAFSGCSSLASVTIPSSVTSIAAASFLGCESLKTVTINSNSIMSQSHSTGFSLANYFGEQVDEYTIGNEVNSIGGGSFSGCENLKKVTIPNSVTSIGSEAFEGCRGLTEMVIPNSVTSIESYAFSYCSGLTSVELPNSVVSIGDWAFYGCTSLKSLTISNNITSINSSAFRGCSSLTNLIIPKSVTAIGYYAFRDCTKLRQVTIPKSIETIGEEIFYGCSAMESIYSYIESPVDYKDSRFNDKTYTSATLYVPTGTKTAYQSTNGWKKFSNIVEFETKLKLIYLVDGEEYKSFEYEEGDIITPEIAPTKEGYTFSGWSEIPETMPTNDVVVTGTFSVNKYKLTYFVDNEEYKSYEVEYGSSITPEIAPTKEGYTFSGWSEIPETMPANDVVVTGTFSVNKYKLTYFVDNEEYKSYEVEYGSSITPETEPSKEGYTFSGWSEIPETMPAQDVEITGYFTYKKGDANGDGKITANDIVAISQYIMGNMTDINIEAADANGDGQVTANDIVYLSYYILHGTFPEQ